MKQTDIKNIVPDNKHHLIMCYMNLFYTGSGSDKEYVGIVLKHRLGFEIMLTYGPRGSAYKAGAGSGEVNSNFSTAKDALIEKLERKRKKGYTLQKDGHPGSTHSLSMGDFVSPVAPPKSRAGWRLQAQAAAASTSLSVLKEAITVGVAKCTDAIVKVEGISTK